MPSFDVDLASVIVATLAYYLLGAAWYGVLSGPWVRAIGTTTEAIQEQQQGRSWIYLAQFAATLLLVLAAGYWIVNVAGARGAAEGALAALLLSPVAILASSGDFLYERRSLALFVINSGYRLAGLVVAGAILGAWAA